MAKKTTGASRMKPPAGMGPGMMRPESMMPELGPMMPPKKAAPKRKPVAKKKAPKKGV